MRQRFKRIISLLLLAAILNSALPVNVLAANETAAETAETWFVFDQDTNTITSYSQDVEHAPKDIVIPSTINGVEVKSVGAGAFKARVDITSVVIPDTVTTIDGSAFQGCTGLRSVKLGNGVTSISGNAFSGCSSLTDVQFSDGLVAIGIMAFWNCSKLTGVVLPDSVEKIGQRAFSGCSSLTDMRLPSGVALEDAAFADCTGLTTAQKVERWSSAVIHNILTNEKYMGDALLQKTYITDCITKKVKKNMGERPMYYVENNHPAIISRETFDQVQKEMTRRSSKRKVLQKSGKTELGKYSGKYALTELLVCGECGSPYKRVTWARNGKKRIVWRCVSRLEFGTKYCHNSPTLDESRLHNAILAAMNEYAAIRQEVCPDVLAMVEEAKRAMSQAGTMLLELKKRMDAVSQEQSNVLDRLLANMADAELNARMKALTDEKEALKAQILKVQQKEVSMAEQAAKRQQMWDSLMECSAGYTEFDDEFVRQIIQKITVEDAETIHIHFRDSDVVLEQEVE